MRVYVKSSSPIGYHNNEGIMNTESKSRKNGRKWGRIISNLRVGNVACIYI